MKYWQQKMFIEYGDKFDELLQNLPVPETFVQSLTNLIDPKCLTGNILDLCCGSGRLFPIFTHKAKRVIGIDFSSKLIEIAAKRYSNLKNVELICGDIRHLPPKIRKLHFNLIVRIYTSVGYFPYNEELEILKNCLQIADQPCYVIVDTFNGDWFKRNKTVDRCRKFGSIKLTEHYEYDSNNRIVNCRWVQYHESCGNTISIPFTLDVYESSRIIDLLREAGWGTPVLYADYSALPLSYSELPPERIVAVSQV